MIWEVVVSSSFARKHSSHGVILGRVLLLIGLLSYHEHGGCTDQVLSYTKYLSLALIMVSMKLLQTERDDKPPESAQ